MSNTHDQIHYISSYLGCLSGRLVLNTALPAPSVHHDCLQFTCVSQPCILQQVVNISQSLSSPGLHVHPLAATGQVCWRLHHPLSLQLSVYHRWMLEFLFSLHCSVGRLFLLLVLGVLVPLVPALFLELLGRDRLRSRGQLLLLGEHVDSVVFVSEHNNISIAGVIFKRVSNSNMYYIRHWVKYTCIWKF